MDKTVLECKSLTKSYKGKTALNNVNLTIPKGRIIGLLGANGSGKTTLLKLINGLLVPDEGEIRINGLLPSVETKKRISYLPDASYLNDWMTSEQLIHFSLIFTPTLMKRKHLLCLKN